MKDFETDDFEQAMAERLAGAVSEQPSAPIYPSAITKRAVVRRRTRWAVAGGLGVASVATAVIMVMAFAPWTPTSIPAEPLAPAQTPTPDQTSPTGNEQALDSVDGIATYAIPQEDPPGAGLVGKLDFRDGCLVVSDYTISSDVQFQVPIFPEGSISWIGPKELVAFGIPLHLGDEIILEGRLTLEVRDSKGDLVRGENIQFTSEYDHGTVTMPVGCPTARLLYVTRVYPKGSHCLNS